MGESVSRKKVKEHTLHTHILAHTRADVYTKEIKILMLKKTKLPAIDW